MCLGVAGLREGSRHCVDSQGASVPCCEWSPSPWARSYMSITSLVLLWTVSTVPPEIEPVLLEQAGRRSICWIDMQVPRRIYFPYG